MKGLAILAFSLLLSACGQPVQQDGSTLQRLNTADFHGRWLVINYWAQWCKPCIKEIPELNALDRSYPQVAVLGVNFDGARGADLQAQVDQLGVAFPTLLEDPAVQLGLDKPAVLPTTLILDPDGNLVANLVGPQTLASLALATGQVAITEAESETENLIPE